VRALAILAGVLLAGYTIHHPILLIPELAIAAGAGAWLLASSALGAARLLRYGGRRARREWRHR
jgi:hypothetical protein